MMRLRSQRQAPTTAAACNGSDLHVPGNIVQGLNLELRLNGFHAHGSATSDSGVLACLLLLSADHQPSTLDERVRFSPVSGSSHTEWRTQCSEVAKPAVRGGVLDQMSFSYQAPCPRVRPRLTLWIEQAAQALHQAHYLSNQRSNPMGKVNDKQLNHCHPGPAVAPHGNPRVEGQLGSRSLCKKQPRDEANGYRKGFTIYLLLPPWSIGASNPQLTCPAPDTATLTCNCSYLRCVQTPITHTQLLDV